MGHSARKVRPIADLIRGKKADEAPKEKSTETGAYKNKDGAFKDVMDLLDSDEVKTFKVLRWGGEPARAFRGLIVVNNQNDHAWKLHVDAVNHRFDRRVQQFHHQDNDGDAREQAHLDPISPDPKRGWNQQHGQPDFLAKRAFVAVGCF